MTVHNCLWPVGTGLGALMLKVLGKLTAWAIAIALIGASVIMNGMTALHFYGGSQLTVAVVVFGIFAGIDAGKYVAAEYAPERWRQGPMWKAARLSLFILGASLLSVFATFQMTQQGLEALVAESKVNTQGLERLKARQARLTEQLDVYGPQPTPEIINAKLEAQRYNPRWRATRGCEVGFTTAAASREFCTEVKTLEAQLAGATRAQQLRQQIVQLDDQITAAETGDKVAKPLRGLSLIATETGLTIDQTSIVALIALALIFEVATIFLLSIANDRTPAAPSGAVGREGQAERVAEPSDTPPGGGRRRRRKASTETPSNAGSKPSVKAGNVVQLGPRSMGLSGGSNPSVTERFAAACLGQSRGARIPHRVLREEIVQWCEGQGFDPPSEQRMGRELTAMGLKKTRSGPGGTTVYHGIELIESAAAVG